jgi:hypothetical protein
MKLVETCRLEVSVVGLLDTEDEVTIVDNCVFAI